jgi:hypothetical protein
MTLSLIACQRDVPEPETKMVVSAAQIPIVTGVVSNKGDPFLVKAFVKGNDVFVECVISNFSFHKQDKVGTRTGKLLVYVDGKKFDEFHTAAFIIRELSRGNHRITLQIINNNGQITSLKKDLIISIP